VLQADEDVKALSQNLLQLESGAGDVVIRGGPTVKINT